MIGSIVFFVIFLFLFPLKYFFINGLITNSIKDITAAIIKPASGVIKILKIEKISIL
jgi:hypothetical protein